MQRPERFTERLLEALQEHTPEHSWEVSWQEPIDCMLPTMVVVGNGSALIVKTREEGRVAGL